MPLVVCQLNPMVVLAAILGTAGSVALVLLWASLGPGGGPSPFFLAVVIGVIGWAAVQRVKTAAVRLRVDASGIHLPSPGGRLTFIEWGTMSTVRVTVAGPARTPMTVAVGLRPGAPLPRTVKGRITDPDDPDADDEQLTAKVGDLRLDETELLEALRRYGSARTEIETRHIETFRIGGG